MSVRVIAQGTDLPPLASLVDQIEDGEILYARWLRDPLMDPRDEMLEDQEQLDQIVAKTNYGYYVGLKIEARKS